MADGIAVGLPGKIPFDLITNYVNRVTTVAEEEISSALVSVLERARLLVEPAGATGVAALLADPEAFEPPVVVVISGGNVDPLLLIRVMQHGMAVAGRYLTVKVAVHDSPGGLARLLDAIATNQANVLEVTHDRTSRDLKPRQVDVVLQLETRGRAHAREVVDGIRRAGFTIR